MTHPTDALRLVPVNLTPEMIAAARGFNMRNVGIQGRWEAMLAAAPDVMCCDNCGTIKGKADECDCSRHDGTPPAWTTAAPASPLPEGGGWQDISTAPKDGTPILITRPTSYPAEEAYHVVRWEEADGFWFCHDGKSDTWLRGPDPTHWMPLPAAPTGAK